MKLNNQRSNQSNLKISLRDFPDDIYILLEDDFKAKFFKTAWKINKSYRKYTPTHNWNY